MSGHRRGRLVAASYTGLALSVISAFAVPALAHAASASGPVGEDTSYEDTAGLLPFGPPAPITAVLPAAAAAPTPAPLRSSPPTTSTSVPGTVRALSAGVAYTAPQPGDPPDADFDRLAQCESNDRWDLNTGNGYYGGLQFSASTWRGYGGADLPNQHSREEQIEIARRVWRARGWSPWPSCSRQTGLR